MTNQPCQDGTDLTCCLPFMTESSQLTLFHVHLACHVSLLTENTIINNNCNNNTKYIYNTKYISVKTHHQLAMPKVIKPTLSSQLGNPGNPETGVPGRGEMKVK